MYSNPCMCSMIPEYDSFFLIVGTASAPLSPAPGSKSLPPLPEIPSNKPVPKPRPKEKKIYVAAYDYKPCEEGDLELIAVSALLCMLGNFSCFCCHLPTFFINIFFQKIISGALIVSNGLDPDQTMSVLIWVQTVCKGYQQVTEVSATNCKERA